MAMETFELRLDGLPAAKPFLERWNGVPIGRVPSRGFSLEPKDEVTALGNALGYLPKEYHAQLAPEFQEELRTLGRIYSFRFPKS
jgi:urocanate hydratase